MVWDSNGLFPAENKYLKQKKMKPINTAFAGYGAGGRIYNAPIIKSVQGFSVKKILTSSPGNMEAAKNDFPEADIVSNFSEIIQDQEIELVIIVLPNHLHYAFTKKALEAGKNVMVEKPFTPTTREADELIELARQKRLVLSINHNRRWDSDFLTVRKIISDKGLGRIVEYESHFDRFRTEIKNSWKEKEENPGSGILYDLGSHLIDQALVLFGNPDEIFADIRIQREGAEVPDNFELLLFYPNLKVTLKAGMLVKEKGPTFAIFGTSGSYLKYGADVQEEALKKGILPKDDPNWGKEQKEIWGKLNSIEGEELIESEPGDYREVYKNVFEAILGKADLQVKPQQARDVIRVIELAEKSNREKRVVAFEG